jgi:hypothetical protein
LSLFVHFKPWKTLCGFPPNSETVTLRIPNGLWRPDTVITDYEGTEMFVLLDQVQEMRSYEAIFGDLDGRRLVCIKRHLISAFWRDGYYFCTYQPNYKNQRPLLERDVDNKKVYPFSYLQVNPMKGRFYYRLFDNQEGLSPPKLRSENPWLGYMVVCCTPLVRSGKWTASFHRKNQNIPTIHVDQWRNCVDIGPGNDMLAALCMAYVFDRYQCQPLITVVGAEKEQYWQPDDQSIESQEDDPNLVQEDIENRSKYPDDGTVRTNKHSQVGSYAENYDPPNDGNDDDYGNQEGELFHDFDEFVNSRETDGPDDSISYCTGSKGNSAPRNSDLLSVDDSMHTTPDGTNKAKVRKSNDHRVMAPSIQSFPNADGDFVSSSKDESTDLFSISDNSSSYYQPTVFTDNDSEDWITTGTGSNDGSIVTSAPSSYNPIQSKCSTVYENDDEKSEPRIV